MSKWEPQVVETVPHTVAPKEYDLIVAELFELFYDHGCQLEQSRSQIASLEQEKEREAVNE